MRYRKMHVLIKLGISVNKSEMCLIREIIVSTVVCFAMFYVSYISNEVIEA